MTKNALLGFVRHILTFGGGFLVSEGVVSATQLETGLGALITLSGVVWSIFDKKTRY